MGTRIEERKGIHGREVNFLRLVLKYLSKKEAE